MAETEKPKQSRYIYERGDEMMKKLITLMLVTIMMVCLSIPGSANVPAAEEGGNPKIKIKIWMMIEFGRPRKDCKGFGLCITFGIETLSMANGPKNTNSAVGEAYFNDQGEFVIEFLKDYMLEETKSIYFDQNFKVEEEYELPREILDALNFKGRYVIKTGQYDFENRDGRLIVKF